MVGREKVVSQGGKLLLMVRGHAHGSVGGGMRAKTLLPDAAVVQLEELLTDERGITMVVSTTGEQACCPACGQPSRHRHSRRHRTITDLPWQGLPVFLGLHFRRFYCDAPACDRCTFTEPLPTVVNAYARRTHRLATLVEALALALGGEGGTRLLAELGLAASPDTLLRVIQAASLPACATPRILGVDAWARRRGKTYGTLLVDLERHRVVEVLPDRTAAPFATWLRQHPGVELISRDRGGAYAEGAAQGAPSAVQVADRFHLMNNLSEVLERVLQREHLALTQAARRLTEQQQAQALPDGAPPAVPAAPPAAPAPTGSPSAAPATRADRERAQRRACRVARYEEVHQLHRQGLSARAIATRLGLARQTVQRFLTATTFPERRARPPRVTLLTPYEPYLRERWTAGCHNAAALYREVQAQGFPGSAGLVRLLLERWRPGPGRRGRGATRPAPPAACQPPPPPPVRAMSPRQARWLFLRTATALTAGQLAYRAALEQCCPALGGAGDLARAFQGLIRDRDRAALDPWLAQAERSDLPEFREFAAGLRRDYAAVAAALEHEWNNGQLEGQVNRLKSVKRAMYGRAGFALLRRRVLRAA